MWNIEIEEDFPFYNWISAPCNLHPMLPHSIIAIHAAMTLKSMLFGSIARHNNRQGIVVTDSRGEIKMPHKKRIQFLSDFLKMLTHRKN